MIGGGTAGLTVAKRLAEKKSIAVAVIEAGGFYEIDGGNFSQIPAYESLYANAPASIDWKISTTPQSVRSIPCSADLVRNLDLSLLAIGWSIYTLLARQMPWRIVSHSPEKWREPNLLLMLELVGTVWRTSGKLADNCPGGLFSWRRLLGVQRAPISCGRMR